MTMESPALDGHYQLMWNGPDQWREQITFPDYDEVQIGGKEKVWTSRTTDFLPFAISNCMLPWVLAL